MCSGLHNGDMLCGFLHAVWSGGPYELIALVVEPRQRRRGLSRVYAHTLLNLWQGQQLSCGWKYGLTMTALLVCI